MTWICLVPCLLPRSICAPGTVRCVHPLSMLHAPSPAVHMPVCLLTSCAWCSKASLGCSSCGIRAPSLGPRCLWAVSQQMLCSYKVRAKPCPVLSPQASQGIEQGHESLFQEQHSGGHWSSESSLLLLDPLKLGLWMCSSDTTDSHPCPPFAPQILSLPLLVITFITITKYCAILQGYICTEIHSFCWHNIM